MKNLFVLLTVVSVLAGCATAPDNSAALQARKDTIAAVSKVEIFYNGDDELVVIDAGGSGMAGMGGLFGPIGQLMAIGADAASKLSVAERAEARSKEFTAAVKGGTSPRTLNQQFAEKLATHIQATGREVKITPIPRAKGELAIAFPEVAVTPGYTALLVRITTGYGAVDALSSYRPTIVIEQSLKNVERRNVYFDIYKADIGEPNYMMYGTLLEQHVAAHEGLRQGLVAVADPVSRRMFAAKN